MAEEKNRQELTKKVKRNKKVKIFEAIEKASELHSHSNCKISWLLYGLCFASRYSEFL